MSIENLLFHVSEALRYPVLILALLAFVASIAEDGRLIAELVRRRRRDVVRLEQTTASVRTTIAVGNFGRAVSIVRTLGFDHPMKEVLTAVVELRGASDGRDRIAKRMADYDYESMRRLGRTRALVRLGPALGLMGTLIPLSPALAGLANGDVAQLTKNLRVAFSVTVVGLLTGAVAFVVSLTRERLYAQDYSDVEFVAAKVAEPLPRPAAQSTTGTPAPAGTSAAAVPGAGAAR